jgi:pyrroloquinoline quinone biosynthesis protein B
MVQVILLGLTQDAGLPQAGCYCNNCQRARREPQYRQWVVSLGLVDRATQQTWLIDATPNFPEQLHALQQFAPTCKLAGIILTHAHMGHYSGLIHLGREAMNSQDMPLYVSDSMADFLAQNAPWSQLLSLHNVQVQRITAQQEFALSPNLHLLPLTIPHRNEFSDTFAFVIRGRQRQLFYCPDIDSWQIWYHSLRIFIETMDVALLDATFFSASELPQRNLSEIPHPLATETVMTLQGVSCEVYLIHLNHSNPLHQADSPERTWLTQQGLAVGQTGQSWNI